MRLTSEKISTTNDNPETKNNHLQSLWRLSTLKFCLTHLTFEICDQELGHLVHKFRKICCYFFRL